MTMDHTALLIMDGMVITYTQTSFYLNEKDDISETAYASVPDIHQEGYV